MATSKFTSLTTSRTTLPSRVAADRVMVKLREAHRALQFVTTIHEAKVVMDAMAAQELFAHRQQLGKELEDFAYAIKIQALAKLGALLAVMPKSSGVIGRDKKGLTRGSIGIPRVDEPATLADLGLDKKTSAVAQQLAALPAPVRDAIAARELSVAQARRAEKAQALATRVPLPIEPSGKGECATAGFDIGQVRDAVDSAVEYRVRGSHRVVPHPPRTPSRIE